MKRTASVNRFAVAMFVLVFCTMLLNAILGQHLWRHVAPLLSSRPGVAELLQGTSGLLLLVVVFWWGFRLKGRMREKIDEYGVTMTEVPDGHHVEVFRPVLVEPQVSLTSSGVVIADLGLSSDEGPDVRRELLRAVEKATSSPHAVKGRAS